MKKSQNGWYVVAMSSAFGCMIGASFSQYSMTVTELSLKTGISSEILLTGDTVKSIAVIVAMLVSGMLVQKIGMKPTAILSILCFLIPQISVPYAGSIAILMLLKIIQGMATIIFPIFITTIIDWVDEKDTGFATAVFNGIFYSGAGIGAYISGIVISNMGWVASYYVIGIIVAVLGLMWVITVKEKPRTSNEIASSGHGSHSTGGFSAMFKDTNAWLLVGIFLAYTWVLQTIAVNIPVFSEFLGYDSVSTGSIMTATSIGIIFSAFVSGKISDFFASRSENKFIARVYVISIGALLIIVCAILMAVCDLSSFGAFYIVCLLYSVGGAWGLGVFWSIVPELFKDDKLSLATGFIGGMGDVSMPISPFIVGIIFGAKGLWGVGWASSAIMGAISLVCCLLVLHLSKKTVS